MNQETKSKYNSQDKANELAGSLRISGIQVTENEERWMADIIAGKIDGKIVRKKLVKHILNKAAQKTRQPTKDKS